MSEIDIQKLQYKDNDDNDISVRPSALNDFIGQKEIVQNLEVYMQAASLRGEPVDHVLFSGPPGLGKTTLSTIIAHAQRAGFHQASAPNLKKPGDMAKILTALNANDVLFIDEIHRLPAPVEEILYSAMEDRKIDINLSAGMAAEIIRLDLAPFTLVGATTRPGSLTAPLRDRFGIHLKLDFYDEDDLGRIIGRAATLWKISIDKTALTEIAKRSRRTPRVALRLLRRVWDYALVEAQSDLTKTVINSAVVEHAFEQMKIDNLGLADIDNRFLKVIAEKYNGGPVGLKPISAVLAEDIITLEDSIEPFLVRLGFIKRSPRGRILTREACEHIGIDPAGPGLFSDTRGDL